MFFPHTGFFDGLEDAEGFLSKTNCCHGLMRVPVTAVIAVFRQAGIPYPTGSLFDQFIIYEIVKQLPCLLVHRKLNTSLSLRIIFRECRRKNVGVAGYAEAFAPVLSEN